jgi:uncharacterized protein YegP (UPF0339 family)
MIDDDAVSDALDALEDAIRKLDAVLAEDRDEETEMMWFEWFKDAAGEYRFAIVAGNGEPVAQSEGYSRKDACLKTAKAIWTDFNTAEAVIVRERGEPAPWIKPPG